MVLHLVYLEINSYLVLICDNFVFLVNYKVTFLNVFFYFEITCILNRLKQRYEYR